MKKRRSPAEIKADLLRVISEEESLPTRIMYRTNLSWIPMLRRLKEMLRSGLIEVTTEGNPGHRLYHVTVKGRLVLEAYRELVENGLM